MTTRGTHRDLLADGLCGRGHTLAVEVDLYVHLDGAVECTRCRREMAHERAELRRAAAARLSAEQRADVWTWVAGVKAARADRHQVA